MIELWEVIPLSIGERIIQKRQEKGWTQNDLAIKVGVNIKSVKDWESGVSMPSAKTLVKLCHLLDTTSDYLLCLDNREVICLDDFSPVVTKLTKAYIQMLIGMHFPSDP